MRKKEVWMKRGAVVKACGDPGVITKIIKATINFGDEYVYNIRVRLDGEKYARVYHPADVALLIKEDEKEN